MINQERNKLIVKELLYTDADIICLQEFWTANAVVREMFISALCENQGYSMRHVKVYVVHSCIYILNIV